MPLHPQSLEVLRRVEAWGEVADLSVAEARALDERRARELGGEGPPVASVEDVAAAGLPARLYRPRGDESPGVLVWFHGGGWVLGSVEGSDPQARALAVASDCLVLSIDYRLAPEHPFPAAVEDCLAATAWAAEQAASLGAAGVAVGGDSAGGNLAAVVAHLARDRGGPRIDVQALVYPVLAHEPDTHSYRAYADGHWLTAKAMTWFWRHYLPAGQDSADPMVSPLLAARLDGLPAAVIATAEYDVLRDEAEQYAARLSAAGVPVQMRRYEGMLHGFVACAGIVDDGWRALRDTGAAVGAALRPTSAVR